MKEKQLLKTIVEGIQEKNGKKITKVHETTESFTQTKLKKLNLYQ